MAASCPSPRSTAPVPSHVAKYNLTTSSGNADGNRSASRHDRHASRLFPSGPRASNAACAPSRHAAASWSTPMLLHRRRAARSILESLMPPGSASGSCHACKSNASYARTRSSSVNSARRRSRTSPVTRAIEASASLQSANFVELPHNVHVREPYLVGGAGRYRIRPISDL